MKIIRSIGEMQKLSSLWLRRGRSVGFVPTMGAFHRGHLALFRRARRENNVLVVSVFVNPIQFGPREDFSAYPRPWRRDRLWARREKVDVLFHPSPAGMYPAEFQTRVTVENLSRPLCGPFRPGHFQGVATVVAKLFHAVCPTRAYFGEKDFQQFRVVERMVRDLNFPVDLVRCPTVREPSGLAVSSRNVYLTPFQRDKARLIYRALQAAGEVIKSAPSVPSTRSRRAARVVLRAIPDARIDYLTVADPRTLRPLSRVRERALVAAAVRVGRARLIDNILVASPLRAGSDRPRFRGRS